MPLYRREKLWRGRRLCEALDLLRGELFPRRQICRLMKRIPEGGEESEAICVPILIYGWLYKADCQRSALQMQTGSHVITPQVSVCRQWNQSSSMTSLLILKPSRQQQEAMQCTCRLLPRVRNDIRLLEHTSISCQAGSRVLQ